MQVSKIDNKAIAFPQLRGSLAGLRYPALAEIKYDGEFNYIYISAKDTFTINKYGTMRRDFPALNEIGKMVRGLASSATLLCEVYWNEGKLGALYELLSHKKDDAIKLSVFDIIEFDGSNMKDEEFITRREVLHELGLGRWLPKCWVVADEIDVQQRFKETTDEGYEGIVVKDLSAKYVAGPCTQVKMKKKDRTEYEVGHIDATLERIEIKVPTTPAPAYIMVGCKAPNRYKKHIKLGDMVEIEHQGVLKSGSLRHPVLIPKKGW